MTTLVAHGLVREDGQLKLDNRESFVRGLPQFAGKRVTLTVEPEKQPKSHDQLGYYYASVLPDIAEGSGETDLDALHIDLKEAFLAKHARVSAITGELLIYTPSLADVSKTEMSQYLERIIAEAAQNGWTIRAPR